MILKPTASLAEQAEGGIVPNPVWFQRLSRFSDVAWKGRVYVRGFEMCNPYLKGRRSPWEESDVESDWSDLEH